MAFNIKCCKKKIAIYCAGHHGIEFKRMLEEYGVSVSLFLDNDERKNGVFIDGTKCLHPEIISGSNEYVIIICVGIDYYESIYRKALEQGLKNIIDFRAVLDGLINDFNEFKKLIRYRSETDRADIFYTRNIEYIGPINKKQNIKKRIAVYTSVFGNYDSFIEPSFSSDLIDYYYISDNKPEIETKYMWIDSREIIPEDITNPILKNRYVKMHPHLIFKDYDYSIYLDANIMVCGNIIDFFRENNLGISVFKHFKRDCIYYEAMSMVNAKRIDVEDVIKTITRYREQGYPLHYGLTEMCVIAREHNKTCNEIMDEWWNAFISRAWRDQLSFMHVLWSKGYGINDLGIIGESAREDNRIIFYDHLFKSKRVKNDKYV